MLVFKTFVIRDKISISTIRWKSPQAGSKGTSSELVFHCKSHYVFKRNLFAKIFLFRNSGKPEFPWEWQTDRAYAISYRRWPLAFLNLTWMNFLDTKKKKLFQKCFIDRVIYFKFIFFLEGKTAFSYNIDIISILKNMK